MPSACGAFVHPRTGSSEPACWPNFTVPKPGARPEARITASPRASRTTTLAQSSTSLDRKDAAIEEPRPLLDVRTVVGHGVWHHGASTPTETRLPEMNEV